VSIQLLVLPIKKVVKGVKIDITVVFENESDEAEHAYGRFVLDFQTKPKLLRKLKYSDSNANSTTY
jgi:hypothetical protein